MNSTDFGPLVAPLSFGRPRKPLRRGALSRQPGFADGGTPPAAFEDPSIDLGPPKMEYPDAPYGIKGLGLMGAPLHPQGPFSGDAGGWAPAEPQISFKKGGKVLHFDQGGTGDSDAGYGGDNASSSGWGAGSEATGDKLGGMRDSLAESDLGGIAGVIGGSPLGQSVNSDERSITDKTTGFLDGLKSHQIAGAVMMGTPFGAAPMIGNALADFAEAHGLSLSNDNSAYGDKGSSAYAPYIYDYSTNTHHTDTPHAGDPALDPTIASTLPAPGQAFASTPLTRQLYRPPNDPYAYGFGPQQNFFPNG